MYVHVLCGTLYVQLVLVVPLVLEVLVVQLLRVDQMDLDCLACLDRHDIPLSLDCHELLWHPINRTITHYCSVLLAVLCYLQQVQHFPWLLVHRQVHESPLVHGHQLSREDHEHLHHQHHLVHRVVRVDPCHLVHPIWRV